LDTICRNSEARACAPLRMRFSRPEETAGIEKTPLNQFR
jgi:hypothetical protein